MDQSVSLKNPSTKHLGEELNCHVCTTKSCHKYDEHCRFRYPRFPTLQTIIAVPARIKYPDDDEREKKINQAKEIKEKVKAILENSTFMAEKINSIDRQEMETYMQFQRDKMMLEDFIEFYEMKLGKLIDDKLESYTKILESHVVDILEHIGVFKQWSSN